MADVSVRPARAEDVAQIARIQVETWRTAYAEVLPGPVLQSLSVEAVAPVWQAAVTAPPSSVHRLLVAMEGSYLVGFLAAGPADPDDAAVPDSDEAPDVSTTIAIAPVLVEPRWGRRGHGSRLLAAAIDLAREDGATRAITWIPEADTVTRDFLVAAGWAPDGVVRALDTGAGELREIRLHTSLVPAESGPDATGFLMGHQAG